MFWLTLSPWLSHWSLLVGISVHFSFWCLMAAFLSEMILWKGLSRIDSWMHRIHSFLSSSLVADNLKLWFIVISWPLLQRWETPPLPTTEPLPQFVNRWLCAKLIIPTCSIYGFPGPQFHCCQFCNLWWFPPFRNKSQTQIVFHLDPRLVWLGYFLVE